MTSTVFCVYINCNSPAAVKGKQCFLIVYQFFEMVFTFQNDIQFPVF